MRLHGLIHNTDAWQDIGPFASFYGWYEDTNTVYMSMEFFELGDLSQYVHTILDEDEVQLLAQQLAQGLKIMHGEGIVHRDMKPKVCRWGLLCATANTLREHFRRSGGTSLVCQDCRLRMREATFRCYRSQDDPGYNRIYGT